MQTDTTVRSSLLLIAAIALFWTLYVTRDLVAPFALAIFFWLTIDAFARWIDGLSRRIPYWLALTVAVLVTVAALAGLIIVVADTVGDVVDQAPRYGARIDELFHGREPRRARLIICIIERALWDHGNSSRWPGWICAIYSKCSVEFSSDRDLCDLLILCSGGVSGQDG